MCRARSEYLRKQELNEGQYGNWLKGVTGRSGSKIGEGRETGRGRGLGKEQEKGEQQELNGEKFQG